MVPSLTTFTSLLTHHPLNEVFSDILINPLPQIGYS